MSEDRELDRLVAAWMGDRYDAAENIWYSNNGSRISCADGGPRYYSQDMNAAAQVWNELLRRGYGYLTIYPGEAGGSAFISVRPPEQELRAAQERDPGIRWKDLEIQVDVWADDDEIPSVARCTCLLIQHITKDA